MDIKKKFKIDFFVQSLYSSIFETVKSKTVIWTMFETQAINILQDSQEILESSCKTLSFCLFLLRYTNKSNVNSVRDLLFILVSK